MEGMLAMCVCVSCCAFSRQFTRLNLYRRCLNVILSIKLENIILLLVKMLF